jgi:putative SOS response-associated peptidase YedK
MCGRYILAQVTKAEREFALTRAAWKLSASWNIAPTESVAVVRIGADGEREGVSMRWGLIPFFTHGEPPKYGTINATVERIETGPCWRGPWRRNYRCILPATAFYEWQQLPGGRKQPFVIEVTDQPIFGFAGLWDRSVHPDGSTIESCTIITLPASPLMAEIHNAKKREPAILRREDREAWLEGSPHDAKAVLRQYPDELLHAYRVSTRVNSPDNDGPELMAPVEARGTG